MRSVTDLEAVKIKMSQLEEGQCAKVVNMDSCGDLRQRLQELGLVPGTCICCLRRAPAGSPVIYNIRGAMVALRACDADNVWVEADPWG